MRIQPHGDDGIRDQQDEPEHGVLEKKLRHGQLKRRAAHGADQGPKTQTAQQRHGGDGDVAGQGNEIRPQFPAGQRQENLHQLSSSSLGRVTCT
jgi:hypothetical protein